MNQSKTEDMAFQQSYSNGNASNPSLQYPSGAADLTSLNPWLQNPPTVMPWTIENRPHLVRFGEPSQDAATWGMPSSKLKYHKRKSDLDFNPAPAKIHITEEKMAAQLKNMHISNNYMDEQGHIMTEANRCTLPTLVLSKEVQSLPSFNEPILPEALVPKTNTSTRALVLWKPPSGSLTSQLISTIQNNSEEEGDNMNNNCTTPDLNAMTNTGFVGPATEMEM